MLAPQDSCGLSSDEGGPPDDLVRTTSLTARRVLPAHLGRDGHRRVRVGVVGKVKGDSVAMARTYRNSAFAGEMLVAAELSRLGYEVLLGNVGTKRTVGVDLAAVDPETGKTIAISGKSLKKRNAFLLDPERVRSEAVYVLVVTNAAGELPEFFVVRGTTLLANEERLWGKWGRTYKHRHGRGISHTRLGIEWRDNWSAIDK